jgi:UDP-N-acetylmuramate--alanine ligase
VEQTGIVSRGVHLVGIGGAGVSALARVLAGHGMPVSGSDARRTATTEALVARGVRVHIGARAEHVPSSAVMLVHSAAVPSGHVEVAEARRRGIPCLTYAEALGLLMESRLGVAVAGTHGKTTTTGMLAAALVEARLDPTVILGGDAPDAPGGARVGSGRVLLVEACEYRRSFHALWPTVAIVTNIDADHLDYYRDLDEIAEAFRTLCARVPESGHIIACAEDRVALGAVRGLSAPVTTYGIDTDADVRATRLEVVGGLPRFHVMVRPGAGGGAIDLGPFQLRVPGRHNVLDALAAIAAARALGATTDTVRGGLERFSGVGRRFQTIYQTEAVHVLDDYAHHPAEVAATVAAARERFPGRRLRVVFQPHQHSRTRRMLDPFAAALAAADDVVVAPIYGARDSAEDRASVSAADLAEATSARGGHAAAGGSHDEIALGLAASAQPGDVILTMGAGDVHRVAERVAGLLRARRGLRRASRRARTQSTHTPARPDTTQRT